MNTSRKKQKRIQAKRACYNTAMNKEVLMELDPDERTIRSVQRHPISVVFIFIVSGFLFVIGLLALFFGVKYSEDIGLGGYEAIFALIMLVLLGLIGLFTWAAVYLDRSNELIVTNENIIQVLRFGLFDKQVSQLNLAKIQDVSVDQNGILPNMFDYGVLEIETAGEVANFRFIHIPQPNIVAKVILEAHEDYMKTMTGTTATRL